MPVIKPKPINFKIDARNQINSSESLTFISALDHSTLKNVSEIGLKG